MEIQVRNAEEYVKNGKQEILIDEESVDEEIFEKMWEKRQNKKDKQKRAKHE